MATKTSPAHINDSDLSYLSKKILSCAPIGYLASRILTDINPNTAAIFNTAFEISHLMAFKVFKKLRFSNRLIFSSLISYPLAFLTVNCCSKFNFLESLSVTSLTLITQIMLCSYFKTAAFSGGMTAQTVFLITQVLRI